MCRTPIEVTSSQLIASEVFPSPFVKALLYPGAIVHGLIKSTTFPRWSDLLDIYNLTAVKEASPVVDLQRLEVCSSFSFYLLIPLFQILISNCPEQLKCRLCHRRIKML